MRILVTGSRGFIGKNLIAELKNLNYSSIFEYDKDSVPESLDDYCKEAEFVFHLAGVNRPQNPAEFMETNLGLTELLLNKLKKFNNKCPIMLASSIQAEQDNPYGRSKKAGEDLVFKYSEETGVRVLVYRFPNVFGKWCRPYYNSAVATFCYNIAHDLPITINDPNVVLRLVYIDDLIDELIRGLEGKETRRSRFCEVPVSYTKTLKEVIDAIYSFKRSRDERSVPDLSDPFIKKLYSTYLSYLPMDGLSYLLKMNIDYRGSFTEFIKTIDRGQVSVNIFKPGVVKGNHWHHTKSEKFLVVSGRGVIRLRRVDSDEIIEYCVCGEKLEVVEIPPGYTHNIENIGNTDMVTVIWVNEPFNPDDPDTYYLEV